tara:strand:+ start:50541 stop:51377 length:837 start_codon:yes stop_codon:yes gene_type:complete
MNTTYCLQGWSKALADDFPLDANTFLLASIIPLAEGVMQENSDETLLVVYADDVRNHTKLAIEGFTRLIEAGYAKWFDTGNSISIGTTEGMDDIYYFESTKRLATTFGSTNTKKRTIRSRIKEETVQDVLPELDELFNQYKRYCDSVGLGNLAEKTYDKIKQVINKVRSTGKFTSHDLLMYLDCMNAMVESWSSIPTTHGNAKSRKKATEVLGMASAVELLKIVPYFVQHYPQMASRGYESTNIYTLSFSLQKIRPLALNTGSRRVSKKSKFGDDDTL